MSTTFNPAAPGGSITGGSSTTSLGAFNNTNTNFTGGVVQAGNEVQAQEAQLTIESIYRQAERNRLNRIFDETLQYVQDKFTQHKNAVNNLGGAAGA